ncbi:MAG: hypothetical protein IH984_05885 [Planctomycetes bacterium]|nr:hypothetical protein [Planctomycetota bacterium]
MQDKNESPASTAKRWLFRLSGLYYILASVGLGIGAMLMPRMLDVVIRNDLASPSDLPGLAKWCMDNRSLLPLLALPTLVCGIVLMLNPKRKWLMSMLGLIAMMLPLAAILYCFIAAASQLYNPPPL